jgi:RNA polymerase sigma factor (sigma-70 family)
MISVNLLDENLLLWKNFRNGSSDAFGELMRTHYPDLFHYGTRFTKDEHLVKECIQDLFLNLWFNRLTIGETSFVKVYLFKTLRHGLTRAIQRSGRLRRRTDIPFDYLFNPAAAVESGLREEPLMPMTRKLRKVITALSKRQQEVIYLRFYIDADIEEVADIMALSRQSVIHLLHDSLHRLRRVSPKKVFWFPHLLPLLY